MELPIPESTRGRVSLDGVNTKVTLKINIDLEKIDKIIVDQETLDFFHVSNEEFDIALEEANNIVRYEDVGELQLFYGDWCNDAYMNFYDNYKACNSEETKMARIKCKALRILEYISACTLIYLDAADY